MVNIRKIPLWMRANYLVLLLSFLLLSNCSKTQNETVPDPEPEQEQQEEEPPLARSWVAVVPVDGSKPVQRHEAAFTGVGNKFYLLGGRGIKPVSIFDTQTQTWSEGSEPPLEIHHFQPVVYQDKIVIIGAMTGQYPNETPVTHIYIYDPMNDQWSQGDEIPPARRRGSTGNVLHNGKIYISCGIKNGHIGDHKNWLDRYDPNTGNWEILADAPRARDHFQAVLANGSIYLPGGRNSKASEGVFGNTLAEVDKYDPATDSWITLPNNLPVKRAGNSAISFEGKIIVAGGESDTQEEAHSEVEAIDPSDNSWENLAPLLEGRHGTGLLEYDGDLYIASGSGKRGGSPELFSMEKFSN